MALSTPLEMEGYKRAMGSPTRRKRVIRQTTKNGFMARTKEEETEWQTHRDELKALWLDQRRTLEQIQEHMSQRHSFRKSAPQYTRQFKKWGFKKNLTDEDWKFVAHRREKRKRDGKDPGDVRVHGNLIPEPKVRKETARHVSLLSQCLGMGGSDPKTPEGVVVGTPRLEIDGTVSDDSAVVLATDWGQGVSVDDIDVGTSTMFQSTDRDPHASRIEVPEPRYSQFSFQGNVAPTATPSAAPSYLRHATLDHRLPVSMSASTPISITTSTHIQEDVDSIGNAIAEETRWTPLEQTDPYRAPTPNDPISVLEHITVEDANRDLTRRAEAIFQSPSPENMSHYLSLCVYLSSNNMMSQTSTYGLVFLIKKSGFQSRLKALLKSTTRTIEIIMGNLLASAAAVGDIEICRILIEAGADLDAPSGMGMRETALHRALWENNVECARTLLEAGANPNLAVDELTPLHTAYDMSEALDFVDLLHQFGVTLIHRKAAAVENGHVYMVKMLLKHSAKIKSDRAKFDGISVMEAAAKTCNQELQLFLDEEPDIISAEPITKSQVIGLALNCWKCDVPLLELLLKGGAAVNINPCPQVVECLLSAGANINHHWESSLPGNVTALQAAVSTQNIDTVLLLLERGADVNAPANKNGGKTALQRAVSQNHQVMTELLVHHGADVNGSPSPVRGRTALQEAASSGYVQLSEYILAHGADINALAAHLGGVALQGAAMHGNYCIVMMLLLAGADVNGAPAIEQGLNAIEAAVGNGRPLILHLLLNYHPDTEEFEITRKRAAKLALANGLLAIGRFLLAYRKHP
ncbi:hypothetical protein Aspvir_007521 [Aspergillus viridinutans]|uniref:Clr5 domain-containing protein n=1 Tax=Aspergillus viridinutans TaxID=75553 RepID=A0A9P3BWA8_ASPVI|nr:uncharacterized protein Aspvir_007521 [Aspergillus viridinutans]GIK03450.1 hypothetical protein Aspvir_007521 [Aspergillus viridinutans]